MSRGKPRSDEERAVEALAVAERRVERAREALYKTEAAHKAAEAEVVAAVKRRDYLATDPALPQRQDGGDVPDHDHKPVQHRDGKPPWCDACGKTADGSEPESRLDR